LDILEFDVQVLVDGFEGPFYGDVVFEFDGYVVVDEGFEKAVNWELVGMNWGREGGLERWVPEEEHFGLQRRRRLRKDLWKSEK
jgi:hypothetical protein